MAEASDQTPGGDAPRDGAGVTAATAADVVAPLEQVRALVLALYQSHGEELRRFVLGVVRDPDVAADVIQATFSRALEQGHTARAETFKGWLFQVAFREALAQRRREQADDRARRKLGGWLGPTAGGQASVVDEPLILGEAVEAVRHALKDLSDEQRRVVVARVYDDKTFAEIARESGLPLGTVLTRMRLALNRLRAALRETEP